MDIATWALLGIGMAAGLVAATSPREVRRDPRRQRNRRRLVMVAAACLALAVVLLVVDALT